ncbi:Kinesin-like protein kip2 [Rhodotorula sphaerocarpa]
MNGSARRESDVPRRKAGFGPPATPMRSAGPSAQTVFENEEGGAGLPLADADGVAVREDGIASGETTETEEDDRDGKQENVVVCLRVRPPKATSPTIQAAPIYTYAPDEALLSLTSAHPTLLKRFGSTSNVTKSLSEDYDFRFDLLHVHPLPTEHLYDRKIKPVVKAALGGFNGTVFAYGQTASGKTHTMLGSPTEPGIIPLAVDELFSHIHQQQSQRSFSLRVSFLEIYNEHLRDLLAPPPSPFTSQPARGPEIVENGLVKNLHERAVSLPGEVLEVLKEGETRRRVGATDWNERSSRSHCVFVVTIESMNKTDGSARTSKLNLIDLAGSESATGQEERRKEGAFINKSLLTLGTVIGKLTDPSSSSAHIPYRDSKLTRLLQPALSGNSRVAVICTVSPDLEQAAETLSTLKFAKRAKMVVTKAERGVLVTEAVMLKRYAAQIATLQTQISSLESNALASERDEAFARLTEAERLGRQRQDALEEKERELERLREQLNETRRFVLTGPELERSVRRVSGNHLATNADLGVALSPSRSRSLRGSGWSLDRQDASVDEMGALGLGTPKSMTTRRAASSRLSRGVGTLEEIGDGGEGSLLRQLEEARAQLQELESASAEAETVRTRLQELEAAAEAHATEQADHRQRVLELQAGVERLEAELERLAMEREQLRTEMEDLRQASQKAERDRTTELAALQEQLEQARQDADGQQGDAATALQQARDTVRDRDSRIAELDAGITSLEARLKAKDAETRKVSKQHETEVASLRQQVDNFQRELASLAAARDADVAEALEKVSGARLERDVALKSVEEAEQRVKDVEELLSLQSQQHDAAEQQTLREKDAAVTAMQLELDHAKAEARLKAEKAEQLQRAVDGFERLEAQRQSYGRNRRAGTDMLKSRLADLQARTSNPANPLARSESNASSSSTISASTGATSDADQHVELQIRNAELSSRVLELEKQLEVNESRAIDADAEHHSELDLQRRQLEETEARAEDWRQKYLAAQRILDKLMATQQSSDDENSRPVPGAPSETAPARRTPLYTSQSSSRPSLLPASPSRTDSVGASWIEKNRPPPLPYSPHQRERERKARRETIARDLAKLKQHKVVGEKRDGWDSPQASPTKSDR